MNPIVEIRGRIAAKKSELAALVDAPCSHAEVRERIAAWCRAQQAEGDRLIGHHVSNVAYGGGLEGLFKLRPQGATIDLAPTLIGLIGAEGVAALLDRHVVQLDDGPSSAERAQGVAALRAELFALELDEEALIEASERDGMPIARRVDADPAAVLWVAPSSQAPVQRRNTTAEVPKLPAPPRPRLARSAYLEGGE